MMYLPYWMTQAQQSGAFAPNNPYFGPQSQYQDPAITQGMTQPNIFANAQTPYDMGASPMSGGVSGLSAMLQNEQAMQGIAALGQALASRKSGHADMAPVPPAQIYNGTPTFMPRF